MKIFNTLAILGFLMSSAEGRLGEVTPTIINGDAADEGEYPYYGTCAITE